MTGFWIFAAALNAFVAVGMGAFATHGLKGRVVPGALDWIDTAASYGLIHAVALLAVSLFAASRRDGPGDGPGDKPGDKPSLRYVPVTQAALLFGCIFFSGPLYIMGLTGLTFLGAVVPLGGTAFLLAWLTLMIAGLRWSTARS